VPDVDPRSVPFDVGVPCTNGGGLRHGRYVKIYSLSLVMYCRLIIALFIAGLLWVTGLWITGLMADCLLCPLRHPVSLGKAARLKWMRI
jgi:hypothetical protein